MSRTMYDSVTAANLPSGAPLYAGYVDGSWPSYADIVARFPHATVVPIATNPSHNAGTVLDCEPGNCTPAQTVPWVQMRRAAGVDPTVYCSESDAGYSWADCVAAFNAAGVAQPHYWVAAYPGAGSGVPAGAVAHQYEDAGPYDISTVLDYWPGVDPPPTPPSEALNMNATDPTTGGFWVFFPNDGHIESYGGAPYLGAINHHAGTWTPIGTPVGFCAQNVPSSGGWGYNITYLLSAPNAQGEWCANYFFPRNGSENPRNAKD